MSLRGRSVMGKCKKKPEDLGECAYCPKPATMRAQLPPQGLFANGMPNKPWVPSCLDCNRGASEDDEYMQGPAMLCGADACSDARDVEERFMRALEREEAKGLQSEVRRDQLPRPVLRARVVGAHPGPARAETDG